MVQSSYKEFGIKSRKRIVDNFSTEKMVINTEKEILKCVDLIEKS